jgi:hypothetical protein
LPETIQLSDARALRCWQRVNNAQEGGEGRDQALLGVVFQASEATRTPARHLSEEMRRAEGGEECCRGRRNNHRQPPAGFSFFFPKTPFHRQQLKENISSIEIQKTKTTDDGSELN